MFKKSCQGPPILDGRSINTSAARCETTRRESVSHLSCWRGGAQSSTQIKLAIRRRISLEAQAMREPHNSLLLTRIEGVALDQVQQPLARMTLFVVVQCRNPRSTCPSRCSCILLSQRVAREMESPLHGALTARGDQDLPPDDRARETGPPTARQ